MQEQKMVERKKEEKMGPESGMNGTSEPELRKASGGSNMGQPNLSNPYANEDTDQQFKQKGSENQPMGNRGETGSDKGFRSGDNSGIKKDVEKDWQSGEQRIGGSSNPEMRKEETWSSEKEEPVLKSKKVV
jgi:hypothetical protein